MYHIDSRLCTGRTHTATLLHVTMVGIGGIFNTRYHYISLYILSVSLCIISMYLRGRTLVPFLRRTVDAGRGIGRRECDDSERDRRGRRRDHEGA
jgi:hypothetical protein